MQPLQYYLRDPAAKDNSITRAAAARSNLDAATTMRSAEAELQNTIELRATASEIAAPKPDGSWRQSEKKDFEALFKKTFRREITSGKIEKICWQTNIAALMQPLQYHLRCPAAKENSITHAAAVPSNLDAAITNCNHHVANLHVSTNVATSDDDSHAAIPMRSETTDSRNA